jgi:Protein of unknown function, DUF547
MRMLSFRAGDVFVWYVSRLLMALVVFGTLFTVHARAAESPADLFRKSADGSSETVEHADWDRLLKTYVTRGRDGVNRIDYAAWAREDHGALKAYVRRLTRVAPATLSAPEQFALLANLYNAKTIDIVLDHYPVESIKDISLGGGLTALFSGGPWKAKVMQIGGTPLSLDDIEHGILRTVFKDARVHYALNCASIGCPDLLGEAFVGDRLNEQLDKAAKAYVNHARGVRVRDGQVVASSIYKWFGEDFGGERGVLRHFRKYALPALRKALEGAGRINGYDYDWTLNDARR